MRRPIKVRFRELWLQKHSLAAGEGFQLAWDKEPMTLGTTVLNVPFSGQLWTGTAVRQTESGSLAPGKWGRGPGEASSEN